MGRRIAGTALCMALSALTGGCGKAWDIYRQAEIGQPLPADAPWPEAKQGEAGVYAWCDSGRSTSPASWVVRSVCVEAGDDGTVVRRNYYASTTTNWYVGVVVILHHVVEFHLPSITPELEAKTSEATSSSLRDQIIRAARLSDRVLVRDCADDGLDFAAFGWNGNAVYGCFMMIGSSMHGMTELPLDGIETPGYDETFRDFVSGSVRYQNLGSDRYRMEMVFVEFMDPLSLTYWPRVIPGMLASVPEQDCIRVFDTDGD